jgi:hypothetical protein
VPHNHDKLKDVLSLPIPWWIVESSFRVIHRLFRFVSFFKAHERWWKNREIDGSINRLRPKYIPISLLLVIGQSLQRIPSLALYSLHTSPAFTKNCKGTQ